MSRVHDALRRAEQMLESGATDAGPSDPTQSLVVPDSHHASAEATALDLPPAPPPPRPVVRNADSKGLHVDWRNFLGRCQVIPFRPAPETHLIDIERPHEVPGEEFRSLRTRLNHMQSQQDLHAIVVTSASPAEGKTFTAINLALAQAQLETPVLLVDLDLRRPVIHNMFQCDKAPGFSDFLLAERPLEECVRRIQGTNLYFMPAGTQVRNPLELLNMKQVKYTIDAFRKVFNWVILDTPPLLFSADANLLATLTDGTLIVVRIGSTTYDNVIRAMQTLCENNVLGIVANGARAGELYSKYTYYYTKSDAEETPEPEEDDIEAPPPPKAKAKSKPAKVPVIEEADDDEDEDDE
jgi:receptor protein-tyrosine kinase